MGIRPILSCTLKIFVQDQASIQTTLHWLFKQWACDFLCIETIMDSGLELLLCPFNINNIRQTSGRRLCNFSFSFPLSLFRNSLLSSFFYDVLIVTTMSKKKDKQGEFRKSESGSGSEKLYNHPPAKLGKGFLQFSFSFFKRPSQSDSANISTRDRSLYYYFVGMRF